MVITTEDYELASGGLNRLKVPGKTQTHMLVTPNGFQVLGFMTNSRLIHDLFCSLKEMGRKEFIKTIETETFRDVQKTTATSYTLSNKLNTLYNLHQIKYKNFCFACKRLLSNNLDYFFLELLDQIIEKLLQIEKFSLASLFGKKLKFDLTNDSKEKSDPAMDYLMGPPSARTSNRVEFLAVLEPLIVKSAKEKTLHETLKCMSLYVKSSQLSNDTLIVFNEFVRAFCNEPKLALLATELADSPKNPPVLNAAEEVRTNSL